MTKRAAKPAAEIEVGDRVWVASATPALVIVAEVWHRPRKNQTAIKRATSSNWIWLESDKTYPIVNKEVT